MDCSLDWLTHWIAANRNDDCEHKFRVVIETIDNPGWWININLVDTDLENIDFKTIDIEMSEDDWIHCSKDENKFDAYGGLFNLEEILNIFRQWVEANSNKEIERGPQHKKCNSLIAQCSDKGEEIYSLKDEFEWLNKCYASACDEYGWLHSFRTTIKSLESSGWVVEIDLDDTVYDCISFEAVDTLNIDNHDEHDWIYCYKEEITYEYGTTNKFIGKGDIEKLGNIMRIFREWIQAIDEREGFSFD